MTAQEYLWGCELNAENREYVWDETETFTDDFDDAFKYNILLKHAILGPTAADDELNVVELESSDFHSNELKYPLVRLAVGRTDHCQLDILLAHQPCTLRLIKGSGPVIFWGQYLVDLKDEVEDDSELAVSQNKGRNVISNGGEQDDEAGEDDRHKNEFEVDVEEVDDASEEDNGDEEAEDSEPDDDEEAEADGDEEEDEEAADDEMDDADDEDEATVPVGKGNAKAESEQGKGTIADKDTGENVRSVTSEGEVAASLKGTNKLKKRKHSQGKEKEKKAKLDSGDSAEANGRIQDKSELPAKAGETKESQASVASKKSTSRTENSGSSTKTHAKDVVDKEPESKDSDASTKAKRSRDRRGKV